MTDQQHRHYEKSVEALVMLYSVVIGLAITSLLQSSFVDTATGKPIRWNTRDVITWIDFSLAGLVITRFFFGNVVYLYKTYEGTEVILRGWVLLDSLFVIVQAGLLYVMILFDNDKWVSLYTVFAVLVISDAIWMLTIVVWPRVKHAGHRSTALRWMISNLVTGVVVGLLSNWGTSMGHAVLQFLTVVNTAANVYLNYSYLFELAEARAGVPQ